MFFFYVLSFYIISFQYFCFSMFCRSMFCHRPRCPHMPFFIGGHMSGGKISYTPKNVLFAA